MACTGRFRCRSLTYGRPNVRHTGRFIYLWSLHPANAPLPNVLVDLPLVPARHGRPTVRRTGTYSPQPPPSGRPHRTVRTRTGSRRLQVRPSEASSSCNTFFFHHYDKFLYPITVTLGKAIGPEFISIAMLPPEKVFIEILQPTSRVIYPMASK